MQLEAAIANTVSMTILSLTAAEVAIVRDALRTFIAIAHEKLHEPVDARTARLRQAEAAAALLARLDDDAA